MRIAEVVRPPSFKLLRSLIIGNIGNWHTFSHWQHYTFVIKSAFGLEMVKSVLKRLFEEYLYCRSLIRSLSPDAPLCGSFFARNINSAAHCDPQIWYNTDALSRKEMFHADD